MIVLRKLESRLAHALLPSVKRKPRERAKSQRPLEPPISSTDRRLFFWDHKVDGLRWIHRIRHPNRGLQDAARLHSCLRDMLGGTVAMEWRAYYWSKWRKR